MFRFGIALCQIRDSFNVARYDQRLIVRSLDARIFNYEFHKKAELLSKSSFTIVTTPDGVEQALGAISGHSVLGADTETTGLDPLRSRVRLLQIATLDQSFVFDLFQVAAFDHPRFRELFTSDQIIKIFHNAKFDVKMLLHHFKLEVRGIFDTMLASQLISAGRNEGGHGLAAVADRHLGEIIDKSMQVSDWSGALKLFNTNTPQKTPR